MMYPVNTIVEADIETLAEALTSNNVTSVDLVCKYLCRIATYDTRNTVLNSIPLINENIFEEAAAADDRRAAGQPCGLLAGLPFTVKDSYKVKGMSVASGSVAFQSLIANEDAFTVEALRKAGAVLLGKTNMCPMAYGGMLRGVYGRAESPYNLNYLAAAFGSGSSNGSGVSVGASFSVFGMGEETVSSGRSPASNNAVVAYTPSRGLISIRGNWPLYPTCDVVVPHTRTMSDLFHLLGILFQTDPHSTGDFWRDQPFLELPSCTDIRQQLSTIRNENQLNGKRIAVPRMYIEQVEDGPLVSAAVSSLWVQAQTRLEAAGAIVSVIEDFQVIRLYENPAMEEEREPHQFPHLPNDWNAIERGQLIAHAWEDFLQSNADPLLSSLHGVDPANIFPQMSKDDPQVMFTEPKNAVHWSKLADYVSMDRRTSTRPGKSCIYDIPRLQDAVESLEKMRLRHFEEWMDRHRYDYVMFPAAGDVARADADINHQTAEHAWKNGVKYSHGNRVLRHLGIPTVTIPMGMLEGKVMPMGLTILGRAYDDVQILNAAYAFEQVSRCRQKPILTPPIETDTISHSTEISGVRPYLTVSNCQVMETENQEEVTVSIEGAVSISMEDDMQRLFDPVLEVYVDGVQIPGQNISIVSRLQNPNVKSEASFSYRGLAARPPLYDKRNQVVGKIARDSIMIILLARNGNSRPSGFLKMVHISDFEHDERGQ